MLGGILNNTNTLPILDNFLFEINKNVLTLTASDLETTFSTKLTIESEDTGTIALPAKILLDTLKTFPEQPLTLIQTDRNTVEIIANNGKYAVAYVDGSEFPQAAVVPDPKNTVIEGGQLADAINSTLFASGNDDLRPVMSGVFFQFSSESLTFVATDAHKLVKYTRTDLKAVDTAEFIMPKKPLQLLKNILVSSEEEVTIENHGIFCSIVVYPVIPKGLILLRLIPTASHSLEDVEITLKAFSDIREKLQNGTYKRISESITA